MHTTAQREEELAEAELKLTTKGHTPTVKLQPEKIKFRLALFQPREITYGLRELDEEHVKELERVIEINDEVDPILVIKLKGVGFVCVDGHHSIAAYKATGKKEITCDWFSGSVREAMNACMERNTKIKLNLPKHARFEEAWKRTLMKEGSKDEVRRLCVVGEGTIALMRRVMNEAMGNAEPDKVKRCRERLHIRQVATAHEALEKLKTRQWAMVRLDYAGLDAGEEMTLERKVANLARRLQSRFQDHRLSREPEVTARALMVYDRYLPDQLIEEWERLKKRKADVDL